MDTLNKLVEQVIISSDYADHRIWYIFEYWFYPFLVFLFVLWMTRHEKSEASLLGQPKYIKVIATNWPELAILGIASYLLLEIRLHTDGWRIWEALTSSSAGAAGVSIVSFLILGFTIFIVGRQYKKTSKRDRRLVDMVYIPISISYFLFVSSALYDFWFFRTIALVVGVPLVYMLCSKLYDTNNEKFNVASEASKNKEHIEALINHIDAFWKAKKDIGRIGEDIAITHALLAGEKALEICEKVLVKDFKNGSEYARTEQVLNEEIASAKKTSHPDVDKLRRLLAKLLVC